MKKILKFIREWGGKKDVTGALKKKAAVCSAEAAMISIVIHVLLIAFAGSIVAYEYIKRRDAAFEGQNVNRPKLERRQLQMPVKVQNLQKKTRRPKVTTRMASTSKTSLALPDMASLGLGGDNGFGRAGAAGAADARELSSMGAAGSLGFSISSVNFFGARTKGEKMIFIVEADEKMMKDSLGGFFTYQFVKDRIHQMINRMNSATLFNVMFYNDQNVHMFRPQLVPATAENRNTVKAWMGPVNSSPANVGRIGNLGNPYQPSIDYEESVVQEDASGWVKAIQAAMEQKADNIFVLCSEWGWFEISDARKAELFGLDSNAEEEWLRARGWPPERVKEARQKQNEIFAKAEEVLKKENEERRKQGLPPKILKNMWGYAYGSPPGGLGFTRPEMPPKYVPEGTEDRYDREEIIGHLEAVYEYNYIPNKLDKPKVHVVTLIAEDGQPGPRTGIPDLRDLAQTFRGEFEFLRGAKTMQNLIKYNPDAVAEEE